MKLLRFRRQQEPIEIAGIRVDGLFTEKAHVIDPTPEILREELYYWRGVSLGKVACNLIQGKPILNTGSDNNEISFSYYRRAHTVADWITGSQAGAKFQFTEDDRTFLEDRLERPVPVVLPAMVVALGPDMEIEDSLVDLERYDHITPITELEIHSKTALETFFHTSFL